MTNYIVKLMNGDKIKITEQDYKMIIGKTGLVFISSIGEAINTSSISHIYPEEHEDKEKQQVGYLHDGTRVIKYFGYWVDAYTSNPDDVGNIKPVRIDPAYYHEVARDTVATPEEWQKLKLLLLEERRQLMVSSGNEPRKLEGFMAIGKIIPQIDEKLKS